jgi:pyruvate formate-lyase activating enzyme-like uncharacterized protein
MGDEELIIDPRTIVRWDGGEIVIAGAVEEEREAVSDDPRVLALLHAFGRPCGVDAAIAAAGYPDAAEARELVADLRVLGVLVEARRGAPSSTRPSLVGSYDDLRRTLAPRWRSMPYLRFDDACMTVTNCGVDRLSPGCRACKSGGWVCVYAGFECPASCATCPQSAVQRGAVEPDRGVRRVEALLSSLRAHASKVAGVSISGGDPALYPEVVERVASFAKRELPGVHVWAYTSGLTMSPALMARWVAAGLDELRVNLAASDFADHVLELIRAYAVPLFGWVTVEVPSTPATRRELIDRGRLADLAAIGVRQLNLCEVIIPADRPDSNAFASQVDARSRLFAAPAELGPAWTLADSRQITCDVLEHAHDRALDLRINDCSLDAKRAQGLSRQIRWGHDFATIAALTQPGEDPTPAT